MTEEDTQKDVSGDDGLIVLKNITKAFGENLVLDDISLGFEKGKTTVIIGPSGCGKTVLIKHLIMLMRPSAGNVFFMGKRIDDVSERKLQKVRTNFGFLFQGGALFDSMTVFENVVFPIQQHEPIKDWERVNYIVKSKLAMVGMDGFQDAYPAKLSGGQKKRVALARAIALNPEVILYDEPTTGLDPIRSDIINELILKLQRELNVTSIVVTHDMTSAYKIADRIIMIHRGRIVADGDAEHIKNHTFPVVQQFIKGQVSEKDLKALSLSMSDIQ